MAQLRQLENPMVFLARMVATSFVTPRAFLMLLRPLGLSKGWGGGRAAAIFLRVWVALGAISCLWVYEGGVAKAQATQGSSQEVRRAVRSHAHKIPSPASRRRIRRYADRIRYFSRLPYTGRGVSVDPDFIRALIAAESAGRPNAVSEDGAVGLMQILPETGRQAARKLYRSGRTFKYVSRSDLRSVGKEDLMDPALNIFIGCYLLDVYNMQFRGHLGRVVGAWNAGPEEVRKRGQVPPFPETLDLIGKVNAYYLFFRQRQ